MIKTIIFSGQCQIFSSFRCGIVNKTCLFCNSVVDLFFLMIQGSVVHGGETSYREVQRKAENSLQVNCSTRTCLRFRTWPYLVNCLWNLWTCCMVWIQAYHSEGVQWWTSCQCYICNYDWWNVSSNFHFHVTHDPHFPWEILTF